jgi:putative endonuclease
LETLEAIRLNFQALYRKAFGGGKADLVLEDGVDVLECGVEIVATPPGKPLKIASPERVAAFQTGLSAESRAAAFLMAKGYRILAKRFRTPHGEIDIVARKRSLVAFVEVKARASLDEAAYAVTPRQQQRIIAAASAWLMAHPEHAEFELRFDAMLIAPRRLPRHLLAAFDAST